MTERQTVLITGVAGLMAALLVGLGEFLLHYDPLGRFGQGLSFMQGISESRATLGHFIGVLGSPLYILGAWHIQIMLRPASKLLAVIAFLLMSYGLMVGAVWIGSRASAITIINLDASQDVSHRLLLLYDLRYENLLLATRITILAMSAIFAMICLTGRSHYPRWMAALNPIALILLSFAAYFTIPALGNLIMPIALNLAFFILFSTSLLIANRQFGKRD